MIAPLCRLFAVSADELLCLDQFEPDRRYAELKAAYNTTYRTEDIEERYRICEAAVREYPGDMDWLNNFAWVTSNRSFSFRDNETYIAEQERAITRFAAVIKGAKNEALRANAIHGIAQLLCWRGRLDEAREYAMLLPEEKGDTRDEVWQYTLRGEELVAYKQKRVQTLFQSLLSELSLLEGWRHNRLIVELIHTMIPDGNTLHFAFFLYQATERQARTLAKQKGPTQDDAIIALLHEARQYAADYDRIAHDAQGVYRYTAPVFDRIETDTAAWIGADAPGLGADFAEMIADPLFDGVRSRPGFPAPLA